MAQRRLVQLKHCLQSVARLRERRVHNYRVWDGASGRDRDGRNRRNQSKRRCRHWRCLGSGTQGDRRRPQRQQGLHDSAYARRHRVLVAFVVERRAGPRTQNAGHAQRQRAEHECGLVAGRRDAGRRGVAQKQREIW